MAMAAGSSRRERRRPESGADVGLATQPDPRHPVPRMFRCYRPGQIHRGMSARSRPATRVTPSSFSRLITRGVASVCRAWARAALWVTTTTCERVAALAISRARAGQQIGVQAGLRLVEHQELRRPRRQQGRHQEQVAQGAVGQLFRGQRTQQARLAHRQSRNARLPPRSRPPRPGRRRPRVRRGLRVADLADGLQRGREVAPVGGQHRRVGADLGLPGRRSPIGAQMVVEAPGTDGGPDGQHLRGAARIGEGGKHAFERRYALRDGLPNAILVGCPQGRAAPVDQQRRRPPAGAGPDALALDLRIEREG